MTNLLVAELEGKNFKESNTSLTWLVDCLEKNSEEFNKLRGNSKVSDIDGHDISEGKGYLSKVYKVTLTFDDSHIKPYICVLKVPSSESMNEAIEPEILEKMDDAFDGALLTKVHNNEVTFYTQFKDEKDVKLIDIYGSRERVVDKDDGALLMEYLGDDATHVHFFDSLNLEQTLNLFDQILALQIISLKDRSKWKGKCGYSSSSTTKDMSYRFDMFEPNWNLAKTFIDETLWQGINDKVNRFRVNYSKVINSEFDKLIEGNENETVVSHNDLWNNNIIFKKTEDGTILNEPTIIDWQDSTEGPISFDLASILCNCVDPELRHHIEDKHLPLYFKRLKEACEKNDVKLEMTYEKFLQNYDSSFLDQTMFFMIYLGILFNSNNMPREGGDQFWDKKKYNLGLKVYSMLSDAIARAERINSEWLQ